MKSYCYNKKVFGRSITLTGVFCILIALYSAAELLMGNMLFWFVLLVSLYQIYNTFVSISNPEKITLTEDTLTFSAYGQSHAYPLNEITSMRIKELEQYKRLYLRMNEPTMRKGRYWINCGKMNDSKELWECLAFLEYQKEPNQLKFRGRTPKNPFAHTENDILEDDTDGKTH